MQFSFKKIGLISHAEIELRGLTVLGGYNDIGKSFLGKTIFSTIKAVKNYELSFLLNKKEKIEKILNELFLELRVKFGFSPIYSSFQRNLPYLIDLVVQNQLEILDKQLEDLKRRIKLRTTELNTKFQKQVRNSLNSEQEVNSYTDETLNEKFNLIRTILLENTQPEEQYKFLFDLIIKSVFQGEFNSKLKSNTEAEIKLSDNNLEILNIKVNLEKCQSFEVLSEIPFEDVTFIESPLILNLSYMIGQFLYRDKLGGFAEEEVSYYINDLIRKISLANKKSYNLKNLEEDLEKEISKIINGKLYYDNESDEFIYERNDKIKIKLINTASGVKTLGLLQLLYMSRSINKNTLLIIDEPEVHLHPEWQLKYAKLIVSLVKSGVFVMITSHSPYMIEALKIYSDKEISNLTKFYVSTKEKSNEGTTFIDVTENLEPLFQQLALPMQKLGFEG
jgi:predicted ATPase